MWSQLNIVKSSSWFFFCLNNWSAFSHKILDFRYFSFPFFLCLLTNNLNFTTFWLCFYNYIISLLPTKPSPTYKFESSTHWFPDRIIYRSSNRRTWFFWIKKSWIWRLRTFLHYFIWLLFNSIFVSLFDVFLNFILFFFFYCFRRIVLIFIG